MANKQKKKWLRFRHKVVRYTLNYWSYRQVQYYGSYYYSSAVGMSMTFVSLPLVLFVRWLLDRGFTDNTQ